MKWSDNDIKKCSFRIIDVKFGAVSRIIGINFKIFIFFILLYFDLEECRKTSIKCNSYYLVLVYKFSFSF